jgi:hypothetical protein
LLVGRELEHEAGEQLLQRDPLVHRGCGRLRLGAGGRAFAARPAPVPEPGVHGDALHDPREPRAQRERVRRRPEERLEERLLHDLLGLVRIGRQLPGEPAQPVGMAQQQLGVEWGRHRGLGYGERQSGAGNRFTCFRRALPRP